MGIASVLRRLLTDRRSHVVVECRHCGVNVSSNSDYCPACGRDEVSRYEIP